VFNPRDFIKSIISFLSVSEHLGSNKTLNYQVFENSNSMSRKLVLGVLFLRSFNKNCPKLFFVLYRSSSNSLIFQGKTVMTNLYSF